MTALGQKLTVRFGSKVKCGVAPTRSAKRLADEYVPIVFRLNQFCLAVPSVIAHG